MSKQCKKYALKTSPRRLLILDVFLTFLTRNISEISVINYITVCNGNFPVKLATTVLWMKNVKTLSLTLSWYSYHFLALLSLGHFLHALLYVFCRCALVKTCPLVELKSVYLDSAKQSSPMSFNFQHPSLSNARGVSGEIHNKNFIARWWGRKVITDFIRLSILWIFIDRSEEHFTHRTDNGLGLKGVLWRRVRGILETSRWEIKPPWL